MKKFESLVDLSILLKNIIDSSNFRIRYRPGSPRLQNCVVWMTPTTNTMVTEIVWKCKGYKDCNNRLLKVQCIDETMEFGL